MQQLDADMALEKRDRARDGRGRAAQTTPRAGKASLIKRGDEHPHGVETVDHSSVSRKVGLLTLGVLTAGAKA